MFVSLSKTVTQYLPLLQALSLSLSIYQSVSHVSFSYAISNSTPQSVKSLSPSPSSSLFARPSQSSLSFTRLHLPPYYQHHTSSPFLPLSFSIIFCGFSNFWSSEGFYLPLALYLSLDLTLFLPYSSFFNLLPSYSEASFIFLTPHYHSLTLSFDLHPPHLSLALYLPLTVILPLSNVSPHALFFCLPSSFPPLLSLSQSIPLSLCTYFLSSHFSQCTSLRTYAQGECCYKPWHSNPTLLMNFNMQQAGGRAAFRVAEHLPPTCSQRTIKTGRRRTLLRCLGSGPLISSVQAYISTRALGQGQFHGWARGGYAGVGDPWSHGRLPWRCGSIEINKL